MGLPAGLPFYKLDDRENNTPAFLAGIKDTAHTVKLNSTTMKYKLTGYLKFRVLTSIASVGQFFIFLTVSMKQPCR